MQDKYVFLGAVLAVILIWLLSYLNQQEEQQVTVVPPKTHKKVKPKNAVRERLATVEKSKKSGGYKIREPDKKKAPAVEVEKAPPLKKEFKPVALDEMKLWELKRKTEIAQELLAEIFIVEEEVYTPDRFTTDSSVIGAMKKLLEKDTWMREEVQELFGEDVMIGNMLEQINDYAYSKVEDIVVEEDGDIIYVTTEYKEQLI